MDAVSHCLQRLLLSFISYTPVAILLHQMHGGVGLIIPDRSHFTDQITEVLEDHTATKWSTWVSWLLMYLPLLFSSGYSSSL